MNGDAYLLVVQCVCGSASKWPASIQWVDRQSSRLCLGSLIAAYEVHASSPAHAQSGAVTGRRPPPPGHCISLARPHCEETATALQTQPCRNQCGHWSPPYAGTAHSCSGLVPPGLRPSPPGRYLEAGAATSLAHPRLCQSVLLVHRMLAQETTGTGTWTLCNARCITTFRRPQPLSLA